MKQYILKLVAALALLTLVAWGGGKLLYRDATVAARPALVERAPQLDAMLEQKRQREEWNKRRADLIAHTPVLGGTGDRPSRERTAFVRVAPNINGVLFDTEKRVDEYAKLRKDEPWPGAMYPEPLPDEPSRIPGVMSHYDWLTNYPKTSDLLGEAVYEVHEQLVACTNASVFRGAVYEDRVEYSVGLHLVGDGTSVRVAEAFVPEDKWPNEFDSTLRECFLSVFGGISFKSSVVLDMFVERHACVAPRPQVNN